MSGSFYISYHPSTRSDTTSTPSFQSIQFSIYGDEAIMHPGSQTLFFRQKGHIHHMQVTTTIARFS